MLPNLNHLKREEKILVRPTEMQLGPNQGVLLAIELEQLVDGGIQGCGIDRKIFYSVSGKSYHTFYLRHLLS